MSSPIRVAFETSITRFTNTGVAVYVSNLLRALQEMEGEIQVIPLGVPAWMSHAPHSAIQKIFAAYWQILYANVSLPLQVKRARCDLVHYTVPMPVSRSLACPSVVTIHDIIPCIHPEWLPPIRGSRMRASIRASIERADHIITDSEATRRDLLSHFQCPPIQVTACPLGADWHLPPVSSEQSRLIQNRHKLKPGYVLCVGSIEPRKNLGGVLQAYRMLLERGIELPSLVIVGGWGWQKNQLRRAVAQYNLQRHVVFTGYVSADHLAGLYQGAAVFVYPSLYEGFGLPPLEAMACDCPVITSNTSCLPETVGEAAITVDPNDAGAIAEAIGRILHDRNLANRLIRSGRQRVQQFTWRCCAEKSLDVYHKVLRQSKPS